MQLLSACFASIAVVQGHVWSYKYRACDDAIAHAEYSMSQGICCRLWDEAAVFSTLILYLGCQFDANLSQLLLELSGLQDPISF